jgi:uncharacterized membrane protein
VTSGLAAVPETRKNALFAGPKLHTSAASGGMDKGGVMSMKPLKPGKTPIVDDRGLAFAVYILFFFGYFTGITSLIGIMIAYFQSRSVSSELGSHFTFQIRTFWIGVLCLVVGGLLLSIGVGIFVLLAGLFWSLMRNVKGVLALNRNEPIANPNSWLFGD